MKKTLISLTLAAAGFVALAAPAAAQPTGPEANQTSTWVTDLAADGITAECYKHEGTGVTEHGTATDKTVTLAPFGSDWFGTDYALLIVKAGTGNLVTVRPTAGTEYLTPEGKDVSHWIVCKGDFPTVTTTTAPPTTTTPVSDDLTPTVPPKVEYVNPAWPICMVPGKHLFNAHDPECVETPAVFGSSLVVERTPVEAQPTVLAFTGSEATERAAVAAALFAVGLSLLYIGRRFA